MQRLMRPVFCGSYAHTLCGSPVWSLVSRAAFHGNVLCVVLCVLCVGLVQPPRASLDPRIVHVLCAGLFRRSYARTLLSFLTSRDFRGGRVFEECLMRAYATSYAHSKSLMRLMHVFCRLLLGWIFSFKKSNIFNIFLINPLVAYRIP